MQIKSPPGPSIRCAGLPGPAPNGRASACVPKAIALMTSRPSCTRCNARIDGIGSLAGSAATSSRPTARMSRIAARKLKTPPPWICAMPPKVRWQPLRIPENTVYVLDVKKRELDASDIEIAEIEEEIGAGASGAESHVSVRSGSIRPGGFSAALARSAICIAAGLRSKFHAAAASSSSRGETFDDAIKRERDVVVRLHADRRERFVAAPIPSAQAKGTRRRRGRACGHRRKTFVGTPCRARRAYLLAEIYPRPRNRSSRWLRPGRVVIQRSADRGIEPRDRRGRRRRARAVRCRAAPSASRKSMRRSWPQSGARRLWSSARSRARSMSFRARTWTQGQFLDSAIICLFQAID